MLKLKSSILLLFMLLAFFACKKDSTFSKQQDFSNSQIAPRSPNATAPTIEEAKNFFLNYNFNQNNPSPTLHPNFSHVWNNVAPLWSLGKSQILNNGTLEVLYVPVLSKNGKTLEETGSGKIAFFKTANGDLDFHLVLYDDLDPSIRNDSWLAENYSGIILHLTKDGFIKNAHTYDNGVLKGNLIFNWTLTSQDTVQDRGYEVCAYCPPECTCNEIYVTKKKNEGCYGFITIAVTGYECINCSSGLEGAAGPTFGNVFTEPLPPNTPFVPGGNNGDGGGGGTVLNNYGDHIFEYDQALLLVESIYGVTSEINGGVGFTTYDIFAIQVDCILQNGTLGQGIADMLNNNNHSLNAKLLAQKMLESFCESPFPVSIYPSGPAVITDVRWIKELTPTQVIFILNQTNIIGLIRDEMYKGTTSNNLQNWLTVSIQTSLNQNQTKFLLQNSTLHFLHSLKKIGVENNFSVDTKEFIQEQLTELEIDPNYKEFVESSFIWPPIVWEIGKELVGEKIVGIIISKIPWFNQSTNVKNAITAIATGDWIDFTYQVGKIVVQNTPLGQLLKAWEAVDEVHQLYKWVDRIWDVFKNLPPQRLDRAWNILKNTSTKFSEKALKYVDDVRTPMLGGYFATISTYSSKFKSQFPELAGQIGEVHHAVPQKVLNKYPNLGITNDMMHSFENLRGIPSNGSLDHTTITNYWEGFFNTHPNATIQDVIGFSKYIDDEFGHLFVPPVR